jgi:hypothetical protein
MCKSYEILCYRNLSYFELCIWIEFLYIISGTRVSNTIAEINSK